MTSVKSKKQKSLLCPEGFKHVPMRDGVAYVRCDVGDKQLQALLAHQGEVLKASTKSRVRRLGQWVVKETHHKLVSRLIGRARRRSRHPWIAMHYLRRKGVQVPEPLAYIEHGRFGFVKSSAHIFQYLSFYYDVETWLSLQIREGIEGKEITSFLDGLAQAVNTLNDSGAWHADLSGKNIMTHDGTQFYFVDLDAVQLEEEYDKAKRLKNHVQLYDSFCDALSDTLLVPFIKMMLPDTIDLRIWMPKVRKAQQERRTKVEAYWAKHGPPERMNPLRGFLSKHNSEEG
ncbi:MAG: hypothetical protein KAH38_10850 [Candidatus Hydrogenedentes bacterium]|nr:hypothetical protein [Candidatus Hydrogenedentota bacterium]